MNHLSLFTGSGIGDLAAYHAGITTVAQCESEPVCRFCLRRLWPEAYLFEDVHDVTKAKLKAKKLLPIDIISGGFPCQGVSVANKAAKGLDDPRSGLWSEMRRIIAEVQPFWVLAENSPALRVRGADRVLGDLEELGYACWPIVVPAFAFGLRHHRFRCWLVAYSSRVRRKRLQVQQNIQKPQNGEWGNGSTESLALPGWSRGLGTLAQVPKHHDGLAKGLLPRTRTSLLRMVGNGWVYPIARLIFEWIASNHSR